MRRVALRSPGFDLPGHALWLYRPCASRSCNSVAFDGDAARRPQL